MCRTLLLRSYALKRKIQNFFILDLYNRLKQAIIYNRKTISRYKIYHLHTGEVPGINAILILTEGRVLLMKKCIKRALFLTACAAGTIHIVNRFIDNTANMKDILKTNDGEYYDWKNGQIYYHKRGTGSPVLLIHDLSPIASSYEWCRFAKKLEKQHTVYTIDLLGCGRSRKPYLTYTNYLYVQLITDFIKDVIQESPVVLTTNHSISFVVLAANMHRHLIKKIIAINPPAIQTSPKKSLHLDAFKKYILKSPILGTFVYNMATIETKVQKILRTQYFYNSQLVSTKMLDAYYESAHLEKSHGKYLLVSLSVGYIDNFIGHAVSKLETPLAIIASSQMKEGITAVDSYRRLNKNLETSYLSNAGLIPQLEMPERLFHIVNSFLDLPQASTTNH